MQMQVLVPGHARVTARARHLAYRALRFEDVEAGLQLADLGASGVQLLVDAFPTQRQAAATMLYGVLKEMERAEALGSLRDLRIDASSFRPLLADQQAIVRTTAVTVLGCTGDLRWALTLGRVLGEDSDPFVRGAAVDALARLGSPDVLSELVAIAEDARGAARYDAIRAIGRLGADGCSHLVAVALEHHDETARRVAAEALARFADAELWQALLARFVVAGAEVRRTLVEGFGRSRAGRAAIALVRALNGDKSAMVREAAADALPLLREPRVIGALMDSALYDSYTESGPAEGQSGSPAVRYPVREAAAEALLILGGTEAIEALKHLPSLVSMTSDAPDECADPGEPT
jgi:HEAT repeat protein